MNKNVLSNPIMTHLFYKELGPYFSVELPHYTYHMLDKTSSCRICVVYRQTSEDKQ